MTNPSAAAMHRRERRSGRRGRLWWYGFRVAGSVAGWSLLALLAACSPPPEPPPPPDRLTVEPVTFAALPGWSNDRLAEAIPAFARSCQKLKALPPDRALGSDGLAGTAADWQPPCAAVAAVAADDETAARAFFETWFVPVAAGNNGKRQGLFTGYYEAELRGSRAPTDRFGVPLYSRPADLVMVDLGEFSDKFKGERTAGRVVDGRLRPFEDRTRIEAGALRGRGLEMVWVDNAIDAFFLHIQGSGRVVLPDGSILRVGYAGQNGHRYVPIGRELIERGVLTKDNVSMQAIRAWLEANPDQAAEVMNKNPSYVFFKELNGEGPLGAQGVALTPGRSLAVDRSFVPYGVPVWLDAEDPLGADARLRRLMIAQDTGGAIRGPVRGDFFWGYGADAEKRAGAMKSAGTYFLLLPRTVVK